MGVAMAKCAYCRNEIQEEEIVKKVKSKKYHVKCYKQMLAEKYENSSKEIEDKQILYQYIQELYQTENLSSKIKAQIDKYHMEYEISYRHMYLTLKYFFELKENKVRPEYGIGILPHVLNEAKDHYQSVAQASQHNEGINPEDTIRKKIVRQPPSVEKNVPYIDINNL